ncbi:MAG: LysM peptidoglycan-binding domain-containing protein [Actinobacteria bacterium]|nr:LysM peptidoglycan-binding domain-containing protein [Actinomycetota bacterium]
MAARSLIRFTFTGLMLALWLVGASAHYVVREGDTLGDIAASQGVTVSVLAEANQISDPDDIRIGQHLSIPEATAEFSSSGEPRVHVVQQGETLASIANLHGTTAELVAAANGITDGTIYAGTELRLEGSGFVAEPATRTVNHAPSAGCSSGSSDTTAMST